VFKLLARAIKKEKERKGIQAGNEVKLSLFAEDMILYLKDPTRKLLELSFLLSKVVGHKVGINKNQEPLCIAILTSTSKNALSLLLFFLFSLQQN
jgi:hypothetical protein